MSFLPTALTSALAYVTPAPVSALKTVLDYKYLANTNDKPTLQEFKQATYVLLTTAIAVTAFLASGRLKPVLGNHFNNAVTLGTIFLPDVFGQTLLARAVVASFKGGLAEVNANNPTMVLKNVALGLLACAASSKAVFDFRRSVFKSIATDLS
jgi:hypothetical protein